MSGFLKIWRGFFEGTFDRGERKCSMFALAAI